MVRVDVPVRVIVCVTVGCEDAPTPAEDDALWPAGIDRLELVKVSGQTVVERGMTDVTTEEAGQLETELAQL